MKTTASNKKVRELISAISNKNLIPRPEFQRRLVWTSEDKNRFIDTVLLGFPCPEIYIADGDVDLETAEGTQILVDGQQRITTLHQYFSADPDLPLTLVPPYKLLNPDQQTEFLNYVVAVRDLGTVTKSQIIEVFQRINATHYSLNDMEINNAIYAGKLKKFAEKISSLEFFENHRVFRNADYKRMGDLKFALLVIVTLMQGYFNRDEAFEEALKRYNDEFEREHEVEERLIAALDLIDECGFMPKSRAWKRADLFTLIVEFDQAIRFNTIKLPMTGLVERIEDFYRRVDNAADEGSDGMEFMYYKAALQASNDRVNRVRRGMILHSVIADVPLPTFSASSAVSAAGNMEP